MALSRRDELVRLTEASIAVALSVLLGNLRLLELPNGGSIALATLPLLALALTRGVRESLLACACAGAAHALAGGVIVHPVQLVLDYLLAYALLALAGVGRRGIAASRMQIVVPVLLAMTLHLSAMVVSGMVFFAPVAGDAALTYSLGYNAATVVPETLLALWLLPPLVRALARANPADAWRRGLLPPPVVHPRTPRRIHAPAPIDTTTVLTDTGRRPTDILAPTTKGRRPAPAPHPQPRPTRSTLVRDEPFLRRSNPFSQRCGAASIPIARAEPDDRVGRQAPVRAGASGEQLPS